jgi:hypothetical protein
MRAVFSALFRNLPLKLLSLAVAVVFWMNVASEPEMATIVSVPVEFAHYPDGLEISSPITESVSLEARGPAGEIRGLRDGGLAAVVDLSSVHEPADRTFAITPAEIHLPRGVVFVRATPAQVRYRFERSVTKRIPVRAPLEGTLPRGFVLKSSEISPPELDISGPESLVAAVTELTTDPVDLSGMAADSAQSLAVHATTPQGRNAQVRISGDARVTLKIQVQSAR